MKDLMAREKMTELNWPESANDNAKVPLRQTVGLSIHPSAALLIIDVMLEHTRLEKLFWFWYGYRVHK